MKNKYEIDMIDKEGRKFHLIKTPWLKEFLHKDDDTVAHQMMIQDHIILVAVETSHTKTVLSLEEFQLFLKSVDAFASFGVENFLNNYESIKDLYTPEF